MIQALREERMILTRNQRLPRDRGIRVVLIKEEKIRGQVQEVLKALKLKIRPEQMFSRCILCNEKLEKIDKEKAKDRVPEYVFKTQVDFITCPKCKRVYWQGTHWGNVRKILEEINWSS